MAEDEHTRRWERLAGAPRETDPLHALRTAINHVRNAPRDDEARRRLRALAAEQGSWDTLALLLVDESRAAGDRPDVAAACYEELADVYENLDQPLETISAMESVVALDPRVDHLDRLAWLYRRAGAALKAAQTFVRVADLAQDDRARAALRAAGRLYRDSGKLEEAVAAFRRIIDKKPSDVEAWRALDEILGELKRWRELADVRGALAARANGVEKAVMLRAQARALEQAGEAGGAAELLAQATGHAPDDVSGVVDYASVLAREGRGREAADVLAKRIAEAATAGAPAANLAALRLRLVDVLDASADRAGAAAVLADLLAEAPEHVAALERLVQHAAQDRDPRVHAAALLRHAAAIEGPEAVALIAEAARRYREAGELRDAVRTFERAFDITPDDVALEIELEDARTALVVELAIADSDPHRLRQLAEKLRTTLADAPDGSEPQRLAKLVHRYARVMSRLGEADEAHQLLHEAHHLDRRNLQITLALGESCFARKLWRETAIHLGSLAEHPDASKHAKTVATALLRAAQAEVRALRPQNASKHYEAAVRVDPTCAPAWHALAQLATERGDMARAADCLEREASAATDPATRLRLHDALGDLALDVLGDSERAERIWSCVADAGDAALLGKLLAVQRQRGATRERAETCDRLAASTDDARTKKALTEEAAEAFAAAGEHERARVLAAWLIGSHPHDIDAVACASKIALAASDFDGAARWIHRALGAWESSGDFGHGDPRRAELWRRLGDAKRGRGNEREALHAYQLAVSTAPESDAAHAARRATVDLATQAGRSAHTSRLALVEADQDPADIVASAREAVAAGEHEDARAMYELAGALGVELAADDTRFLADHPAKAMAPDEAYTSVLDDHERHALVDDRAEGPLRELCELVGEVANLVCPDPKTALDNVALSDARRISMTGDAAVVAMYPQIAKALGGPATLLYASPTRSGPDVRVLLSSPPVVVIGAQLAELSAKALAADGAAQLRFRLGRIVELSRPYRMFATELDALTRLAAGLWHAFGKPDTAAPRDITREAERLRHALPVHLRRRIGDRLASLAPTALDPQAYVEACARAADRAGLLACGHVGMAIDLANGARHLVELAASRGYLAARRKLRSR